MSCPVYIISHAVRCLPCDDKQFISRLVLNLFNFTAFIESKLCIHVMSSLTTYFNDFSQCNLYLAVVLKDQRDHYTRTWSQHLQVQWCYTTSLVCTFVNIVNKQGTVHVLQSLKHNSLKHCRRPNIHIYIARVTKIVFWFRTESGISCLVVPSLVSRFVYRYQLFSGET